MRMHIAVMASSTLLFALSDNARGAATLVTDQRYLNAYAQLSDSATNHQDFQATFGENPFSKSANASVSKPLEASASAHSSLTTEFLPDSAGFNEFSATTNGPLTASVDIFSAQGLVIGIGVSQVDVTFRLDNTESYELTGTVSGGAGVGLSQLLPGNNHVLIFGASNGSFVSTGTLSPGDYRVDSSASVQSLLGFVSGGSFQFDLKLTAVPEPSTLILAALGGLALLVWRKRR